MYDLWRFLEQKAGYGFRYSTLWWREDGGLPSGVLWFKKRPWSPAEPVEWGGPEDQPLTRFTALRFPC